jgi:hypothetical protein
MTTGCLFIVNEVSGSTSPTYDSGAANKHYVDSKAEEVSVGNVGWNTPTTSSGLSLSNTGMISGNISLYIDDYITSSSVIQNYIPSSKSLESFYPSTLGKGVSGAVSLLSPWLTSSGQKYSNAYASSQKALYEFSITSAKDINAFVSEDFTGSGLSWNDSTKKWNPKSFTGGAGAYLTQAAADEIYYPSSLGKGVSSQVSTNIDSIVNLYDFSTNTKFIYKASSAAGGSDWSSWVSPTAVSGIQLTNVGQISGALEIGIASYIASTSVVENYIPSATALTLFYPSALGKGISSQVHSIGDLSSNAISLYYPSTLGKQISSQVQYTGDLSGTAISRYYPSALGKQVSSQVTKAYASAQIAIYDAAAGGIPGWYDLDTGIGITAFAGAVAISGTQAETISVADYIASAGALGNFYPSAMGKNISSQMIDLFAVSSSYGLVSGAYYGFSSNIKDGTHKYLAVSSTRLSGQWYAPINRGIGFPTAGANYEGSIWRTSGGASDKTITWICVINSAGSYEWNQIAIST